MTELILTVLPVFVTFTIASWKTGFTEDQSRSHTSRSNCPPKGC